MWKPRVAERHRWWVAILAMPLLPVAAIGLIASFPILLLYVAALDMVDWITKDDDE